MIIIDSYALYARQTIIPDAQLNCVNHTDVFASL